MNRYWGGLLATAFIALAGLYLFYKAFRADEIILYGVFEISPKMMVIAALLAECVFFLYVWLGFYTGVL